MAINSILAEIDAEIARLTQARKLLAGVGKVGVPASTAKPRATAPKKKRSRVLSADARKRIADAQRRRWAAQRAKNKKEA